jgi:AcrR family transcriptional regulator
MDVPLRKISKKSPRRHAHWHRRPDARRSEILDAALAVFAEKGFAAARTKDIAERADIVSGTLYLYFSSKEEIFKSLILESIGPRLVALEQMAGAFEGPSAELLRMILRTVCQFLRESDRAVLPKLVISEAGNFPELARFYLEHVTQPMLALFEGIVRRGIERGEFRTVNFQHAGRLAFTPALFTAIWRTSLGTLDSEPYDYEGLIETHLDLLLHGLLAEPGK